MNHRKGDGHKRIGVIRCSSAGTSDVVEFDATRAQTGRIMRGKEDGNCERSLRFFCQCIFCHVSIIECDCGISGLEVGWPIGRLVEIGWIRKHVMDGCQPLHRQDRSSFGSASSSLVGDL